MKSSELAGIALRLNQARLNLSRNIQSAASVDAVCDAVERSDREIKNLAQALERFAVRLAHPARKCARSRKSVHTGESA